MAHPLQSLLPSHPLQSRPSLQSVHPSHSVPSEHSLQSVVSIVHVMIVAMNVMNVLNVLCKMIVTDVQLVTIVPAQHNCEGKFDCVDSECAA